MVGLPCVNCGKEVDPGEAKFFAQVFVCPECYAIAERLYTRGEQELKMMLLLLKESIRLAITRKELQFMQRLEEDAVPKKDLLSELARLAHEARKEAAERGELKSGGDQWQAPTTTHSKATTSPAAATATGKPDSGSTPGQG